MAAGWAQAVKPRDFASQINLSMENCWGIVRALIDVCMAMEDGKYLLVKCGPPSPQSPPPAPGCAGDPAVATAPVAESQRQRRQPAWRSSRTRIGFAVEQKMGFVEILGLQAHIGTLSSCCANRWRPLLTYSDTQQGATSCPVPRHGIIQRVSLRKADRRGRCGVMACHGRRGHAAQRRVTRHTSRHIVCSLISRASC